MENPEMKTVVVLALLAATPLLAACGTGAPAGALIGSTVDAPVAGAIVGAAVVK
jgi:predicted small secreted protein